MRVRLGLTHYQPPTRLQNAAKLLQRALPICDLSKRCNQIRGIEGVIRVRKPPGIS